MNYATQNNIRNYQPAKAGTRATVIPPIGRVRKLDAKTQRRKPNPQGQAEIRTDSHATTGLLKCTFLPKLNTPQVVQTCQKTERDFYKSLSKVAKRYNIEPMQTQKYSYPYNIALAMWDMQNKLKRTVKNWKVLHVAKSSRKTFLATKEIYDTDTTLYYIPIIPLFLMLKDPYRKKNAQLLLSVCSYLYRIGDVPYYRDEGSYLYYHYEMHKDWLEQEIDNEDTKICQNDMKKAEQLGDKVLQKLRNTNNLKVFEQRLSRFNNKDKFDKECFRIACNAFALYSEYPKFSIFRNAPVFELDPHDDDNQIIGMEKYISFCADNEGWLYENLKECINNEFNECCEIEEPIIYKAIDGSRITRNTFDFEKRFFDLLDELCGLLYEYQNELK